MTTPEVYVRKASGMVREFGWVQLALLNIGSGFVIVFPVYFLAFNAAARPDADLISAVVVWFLLSIPTLLVYWLFSSSMPRAGGEYVYISRGLSPVLGFICNFGMAVTFLYWPGVYDIFALNPVLSDTIQVLGVTMNNPGLTQLSYEASSQSWIVASFTLLVLLFGISAIVLKPRQFGKMLLAMFIVSLIGVPFLYLAVAMTPREVFIQSMNAFASKLGGDPDYYHYVIKTWIFRV